MNTEELAFFNQQLAGMLRSGLPLEGALKELSRDLHRGTLKQEVLHLEKDLAMGTPLTEAIQARNFPQLYQQLIRLGAQSGRLEETLVLVADHYHRSSLIWNRVKALAFYPVVTLAAGFLLSVFLCYTLRSVPGSLLNMNEALIGYPAAQSNLESTQAFMWVAPVLFGGLLALTLACLLIPPLRHQVVWILPGFKEASLAQLATASHVLLKSGLSLEETLRLIREMESGSRTQKDLTRWINRLSEGISDFAETARNSKSFPPLFIWLVASFGESIGEGFAKAAQLYRRRAEYRVELLINAAVPASILLISILVLLSVLPAMQMLIRVISAIDSLGA